ncbi:DUF3108 domain-containing protein [Paracrocinitomix mangrovi]|uniref:DUF3108 domain-containing protein n=1 Tax=Paracrocinitomix mangrovi TaxID=2862509 RepID=UPI001C8D934B|nr:DUF3108 domain-containing protein [Paracrocinitomix mangrovi]UKN00672.1 DUF3108 domain-containing protein [Paracrocinitomix mangrovi]
MKKYAFAFAALSLTLGAKAHKFDECQFTEQTQEDNKLINIKHSAFKPGEKLTYRLTYGVFDAGEATLQVVETKRTINGRKLWRMIGRGRTISAFEWFYKVDDLYESYMDAQAMVPWVFKRRVDEGGFKINQDYTFFQHKNIVETEKGKKHKVPDRVQDMISAFYYARTIDFSNAKKGQEYEVDIFLDEELFPTKIKYLGKEVIRTRKGKYRCHKFEPVVEQGRVFSSEDAVEVWITDDGNKIPIMAKAKIQVGSIKMHLVGWEGLANPMAIVK